jgi:hypothetical protein
LANGTIGHGKARKGTIKHVKRKISLFSVCWVFARGFRCAGYGLDCGAVCRWPLSRSIQPYLGVSRSVPPFSDVFLFLQTAIPGRRSGRADLGDEMDAIKAGDQRICLAMGTKRHEKAQNFGCVNFLVGGMGDSSVSIHRAKKGCAKVCESRLVPLYPAKFLVGEKFIFHGAREAEAGWQAGSWRVSCPHTTFASRKAISLPIIGGLARVVAAIAAVKFGLDGVSPYHCWMAGAGTGAAVGGPKETFAS